MLRTYIKRMKPKIPAPRRKPLSKILWSGLGAFLGIYGVAMLGQWLCIEHHLFLLGSFGASAVLIYGAPQADFSQPRNIIGGHIISALVAVALVKVSEGILSFELQCALGVSLAIMAMHFSATMHPPGGATALIYVMGGASIHALGWLYPFAPIGFGACVMLIVALLINNLSGNDKRHYPTYWY